MILTLLKLDRISQVKLFDHFSSMVAKRYGPFLELELVPLDQGLWYTAAKPYNAGIFPYLAMDMMVQFRSLPCHIFFGHDMLAFSPANGGTLPISGGLRDKIDEVLGGFPSGKSHMVFRGFGPRIDTGLNALSLLYADILDSLTRVEAEVLNHLRRLQHEKYADPMQTRTFGLQKRVAELLGKSPVAVHKSLRSAKYHLLSDTAAAMREMVT